MPEDRTRAWPANPDDISAYTLDLEEWLLCDLIIDPSRYPAVACYVKPADMFRDLHRWVFAAMEKIVQREQTPQAISPTTVAHQVKEDCGNVFVAAWLAEHLASCPPMLSASAGGHLPWAAQEIHRLAQARRGEVPTTPNLSGAAW